MPSQRLMLFVAALALSACLASSVLTSKDDRIYERSRQRTAKNN
jgi:hypothetical protein